MSHTLSHYREEAAWALAPFLVEATKGDDYQAQGIALTLLDDYLPATPREVQLSAQIIAYSYATLACLRSASLAKADSITEMLALQNAAIKLSRLQNKARDLLDTHRRQRREAPHLQTADRTGWDDATFRSALGKALDQMKIADDKVPGLVIKRPPPRKPKLKIVSAEPMTGAVLARIGGG